VLVTAVFSVIGAVATSPAGAAVERVQVAGQRFDPSRVEIQVGDSVIWEAGDDGHTVTARDGSFDSSYRGMMAEGDQFRWRFRVPGTYAYYCRVHENRGMVGEVVVVDPSATTTGVTPVTAAATTSTTVDYSTSTTAPATTTSRELATSSTTSLRQATSTTVLPGTPADPQEAPALNPNAPILTGAGSSVLPEAQAAARAEAAKKGRLPVVAIVVIAALTLFGALVGVRTHRRRSSAA